MSIKKIGILAVWSATVGAYTPTNIHMPYDGDFSQWVWAPHVRAHVGVRGQYMVASKAYNEDEKRVPVTQIQSSKESALAMLEGSVPGTPLHGLANRLRGSQDGTRGMFEVQGELAWKQLCVDALYRLHMIKLPGIFSLGVHIPIIDASIHDVSWKSLTKSETLQDDEVHSLLVRDEKSLKQFAERYGKLDIGDQHRTGLGDLACMLYWQAHFTQYRRRLSDVLVQLRIGVTIPTSHRVNTDKAFDVDFGRDGAWGIPLGGGLRLDLGEGIRVGIDVGATLFIRRVQEWRLKTSWAQTPYLLLSKGLATREYGPEWRFTLYGQWAVAKTGLCVSGGYQFFKHTDSTLYPQSDSLSATLINTSPTVDVSESHNGVFGLNYVPAAVRKWKMVPEFSVQATIPFGGRSCMSGTIISAGVSVKC